MIVDKMMFSSMLYGFGVAMKTGFRVTSLKDAEFRKSLRGKTFLWQIVMKDKNKGRYYKLENGKIISKGKISHEKPDFLIEWQDSKVPISLIFTGMQAAVKKDPKLFIQTASNLIAEGKLAMEIEFATSWAFLECGIDMLKSYTGFWEGLLKIPYVQPMLKRVPYVQPLV